MNEKNYESQLSNEEKLRVDELCALLHIDASLVHYLETVDSTNTWARREADAGAPDGSIYIADHQTAGKGRRGRVWQSPAGTSVAFSIVLRPGIRPDHMSMLTLVMGMAAAEGFRRAEGVEALIKWPNDAVVNGRKLVGILTEMSPKCDYVIIGVGLNINQTEFPEELRDKATSLRMETGRICSREKATAAVLNAFDRFYRTFLETADLSRLRGEYEAMLANKNKAVRVLDPRAPFNGVAEGINDSGELLVRREDTNEVEAVFAGEVSVRGIYGYV
ncbi:MAG: biotin--[acetyl-CoA-carboxylase] ligase [Eubacterium sp.]|nr:biotin--[acetyl-CoA-carboxylase] ligase [Eubacterium sp.]